RLRRIARCAYFLAKLVERLNTMRDVEPKRRTVEGLDLIFARTPITRYRSQFDRSGIEIQGQGRCRCVVVRAGLRRQWVSKHRVEICSVVPIDFVRQPGTEQDLAKQFGGADQGTPHRL